MLLVQLELTNVLNCNHVVINFPSVKRATNVYIAFGIDKCNVISLATQLICSHRFSTVESLESIEPIVREGRVTLSFMITVDEKLYNELETQCDEDPCTSRQALERENRRRLNKDTDLYFIKITATRDFRYSNVINYKINDIGNNYCLISEFQLRFFSCTDIILPQLNNIAYGEYCEGNWIDLLSYNYIYGEHGENDLLETFSLLYAEGRVPRGDNLIFDLTATVLQTRLSLRLSRISNLIILLHDVRKIFEYISCGEYTVWFLLMNDEGDLEEIDLNAHIINFQRMKTIVELRNSSDANYARMYWTDADNYVQELLLVAIQLAFGALCKQNIVYLHSLESLRQIEIYETISESLATVGSNINFKRSKDKNYLERIIEICLDLNLTAIIEYDKGMPVPPANICLYNCTWNEESSSWEILTVNNAELHARLLNRFVKTVMDKAEDRIDNTNSEDDL